MRTLRSAFVVTVAAAVAACASQPTPQPEEPHRNPPAQPVPQPAQPEAQPGEAIEPTRNPPAPECPPRESITAGAVCAPEGMSCYAPTAGCQPPGYRCEGGVWRVLPMPTCNPPPIR